MLKFLFIIIMSVIILFMWSSCVLSGRISRFEEEIEYNCNNE